MAERRMFAKTIIDSDAFLDMPLSAQALYFHLSMRADDDGFVNNPKKIQRMVGASDDDCKLLVMKRFILTFESGVIVIKHWKIHNYIQKDRYKETVYIKEKSTLSLNENNAYTECTHNVYTLETQDSIDKISIDKDKKENIKKEKFIPPTFEEVKEYAICRGREDLAKRFYDFFTVGNWTDSKGQKVKNWKQKFITWETHNPNGKNDIKLNETDREYLIRKKYSKEWVMALSEEELKETVNKARKLYGE